MPLITLPPQVGPILARWQAARGHADITDYDILLDDIRTLLHELTTLPDQTAEVAGLRNQITDLQTQVTALTDQANQAASPTRIRDPQDEIAILLEEQAAMAETITNLRAEATARTSTITDLRTQLANAQATINALCITTPHRPRG